LRRTKNADLDRVQSIRGRLGADGELSERIWDMAVANGCKAGAEGRSRTAVGGTADAKKAH
jgi:hypothetical protein